MYESFRPLAGINCNSKLYSKTAKFFAGIRKDAYYILIIPQISGKEKNFLGQMIACSI